MTAVEKAVDFSASRERGLPPITSGDGKLAALSCCLLVYRDVEKSKGIVNISTVSAGRRESEDRCKGR